VAELRQHLKSRRETSLLAMLPAIIARYVHTGRKETYTEKSYDNISSPRDKVTGKVKLPRVYLSITSRKISQGDVS
jgi:hypothetical protein